MKKLLLALVVLSVLIGLEAEAVGQVVLYEYFEGTEVNFTRFFTKNLNVYLVNPNPETVSLNALIGMPFYEVPKKHCLSFGVGIEGVNNFDRFSYGVWGKTTFYSSNDLTVGGTICRATFNLDGDYIVRLMAPSITYKKRVFGAVNFFRNTFGDIDLDVGWTTTVKLPILNVDVGGTYWFLKQKEWWLIIIKAF